MTILEMHGNMLLLLGVTMLTIVTVLVPLFTNSHPPFLIFTQVKNSLVRIFPPAPFACVLEPVPIHASGSNTHTSAKLTFYICTPTGGWVLGHIVGATSLMLSVAGLCCWWRAFCLVCCAACFLEFRSSVLLRGRERNSE